MRIFLTGGTGLIGRHLVPDLLDGGHSVLVVSRDPARGRRGLPDGTEFVGGDPSLPGVWQDRAALCDVVINLAGKSVGEGRWTAGARRRMRRTRLNTTDHVVEAVAQGSGPITLISASATGYYGDTGAAAVGEDAQPGHDFLARLAVEWERAACRAESDRVRVLRLRLGAVLARDGGMLPRLLSVFRLGLGGKLGSGAQYLPWIHIADVVGIIRFLIETPQAAGAVNAVVPSPPTQAEFAWTLAAVLGKPAFLPAPAFALRALLGQKADLLLKGQRAVPNVLKAAGYRFGFPELDGALADLLAQDSSA